MRNLISFLDPAHRCVCASPRRLVRLRRPLEFVSSTLPAVGHCSLHPLWVRSSQFFSPTVGPLFSLVDSITLRVVLNLSLCLQASCLGIISVMFAESAGFTRRCRCGLLDVLVCLQVCLSVCLSVTPCATFSWRSMSCFVANCSLVYSTLTHVLQVVR